MSRPWARAAGSPASTATRAGWTMRPPSTPANELPVGNAVRRLAAPPAGRGLAIGAAAGRARRRHAGIGKVQAHAVPGRAHLGTGQDGGEGVGAYRADGHP